MQKEAACTTSLSEAPHRHLLTRLTTSLAAVSITTTTTNTKRIVITQRVPQSRIGTVATFLTPPRSLMAFEYRRRQPQFRHFKRILATACNTTPRFDFSSWEGGRRERREREIGYLSDWQLISDCHPPDADATLALSAQHQAVVLSSKHSTRQNPKSLTSRLYVNPGCIRQLSDRPTWPFSSD